MGDPGAWPRPSHGPRTTRTLRAISTRRFAIVPLVGRFTRRS